MGSVTWIPASPIVSPAPSHVDAGPSVRRRHAARWQNGITCDPQTAPYALERTILISQVLRLVSAALSSEARVLLVS